VPQLGRWLTLLCCSRCVPRELRGGALSRLDGTGEMGGGRRSPGDEVSGLRDAPDEIRLWVVSWTIGGGPPSFTPPRRCGGTPPLMRRGERNRAKAVARVGAGGPAVETPRGYPARRSAGHETPPASGYPAQVGSQRVARHRRASQEWRCPKGNLRVHSRGVRVCGLILLDPRGKLCTLHECAHMPLLLPEFGDR
jgi:hypothetical protein